MREEKSSADSIQAELLQERLDGSRSASPQENDENFLPAVNNSRGVEEHRVDPALRLALERLDSVRHKQPAFDDFSLEHYLGGDPRQGEPDDVSSVGNTQTVDDHQSGPRFSLDALFAAALNVALPTRTAPELPVWLDGGRQPRVEGTSPNLSLTSWPRQLNPLLNDTSRSTSPGSTQFSCFSASIGSLSSGIGNDVPPTLAERGAPPPGTRPPRRVMPPSAPPPRPGGRPRADSARNRRIQAAVESAAADLDAYALPHSAR